MWIYMLSFYIEASPQTRKRYRPYLLFSFLILILSTAAAVLDGLCIFNQLFKAAPGAENAMEAHSSIMPAEWDRWLRPAGLLWDIALRVGNALLVSTLHPFAWRRTQK